MRQYVRKFLFLIECVFGLLLTHIKEWPRRPWRRGRLGPQLVVKRMEMAYPHIKRMDAAKFTFTFSLFLGEYNLLQKHNNGVTRMETWVHIGSFKGTGRSISKPL